MGKNQASKRENLFFVEAQHFSGRSLGSFDKTLWGGFIIESSCGLIYFAGDTGFGNFINTIHEKYPDIALAILPIGAYKPKWFMSPVHMSPDEAVKAHQILSPKLTAASHFGTFQMADDGIESPIVDLEKALKANNIPQNSFIIPEAGKAIIIKKH